MDWLHARGQKTTATITRETMEGLWPSAAHKGAFYYHIAMKPGLDTMVEGLMNDCYTLGYVLSSAENSQLLSHCFFSRI